jgi:AcrR family transcriptional regulator
MARPRSDERRTAILDAATRMIAEQGLGAPTATIAREAGVSNGSLFLYFDTKVSLYNELFVTLKSEMGAAAFDGLPTHGDDRAQVRHMWRHWLHWATTFPQKRRALAQLSVSDDISDDSHRATDAAFAGVAELLERSRSTGPLAATSLGFTLTLVTALAEAAIDAILAEPNEADSLSSAAFESLWRVLA